MGTQRPTRKPGRTQSAQRVPASRFNRIETERFKCFDYEELIKRDKVNLDIFWLKDEALEQFAEIAEDLAAGGVKRRPAQRKA